MDDLTKKLIEEGLQLPGNIPSGGPGGEYMVKIFLDGKEQQVPAVIGSYIALSNMNSLLNQLMIRLDAVHHHLSFRAHAKSQEIQTCPLCSAFADAARQALENMQKGQDASVVAGGVGAGAATPGVGGDDEEVQEPS